MKAIRSVLLICIFLFFATCSEDDNKDEIIEEGTLSIEGVNYDLTHGEIANSGELIPPGDVYGYLIYLLSSSFDFADNEVSGTGEVVELHFWTDNSESIEPGSYTYFNEESPEINRFTIGFFSSWNSTTWECDNYYKGVSGTINVEKSGSVYTLTMNVITDKYSNVTMGHAPLGDPVENGINITCSFKGKLENKYFGK